jgi:hypothetical protein
LWFFEPGRGTGGENFLDLPATTLRGVQPLELEPYFRALLSSPPAREVVKLLNAKEPLIVLRALEYISGGALPWPYEPRHFKEPGVGPKTRPRKPMRALAPLVHKLLQSDNAMVRRAAAAVFAEMAGARSVAEMRRLLADQQPHLRAIAIGTLARHNDLGSSEAICRAAPHIIRAQDGLLSCQVIEALRAWKNEQIVPALIAFLQDDSWGGRLGDDIRVPTLKAEQALEDITGYMFPQDISASRKAWQEARKLRDPRRRKAVLLRMLGEHRQPVAAQVTRDRGKVMIVLTNRSRRTVTVSRLPASIELRTDSGTNSADYDKPTGKASFITLPPGGSTRFDPAIDSKAIEEVDPRTAQVILLYLRNGNQWAAQGWIGSIQATFAPGWTR